MPSQAPPELESVRQAADRKAVHRDTIRRAIARGDLTGYRMGRRIMRVDPDEVDALFRPVPTTTSSDPAAGGR